MTDVSITLKEIHSLQSELEDAHNQLRRLPLQLKAKQAELDRQEQRLVDDKQALRRLRMDADEKEVSLKSGEERARELQIKLNQCKSTKEYTAIKEEIAHIQSSNSTLEEETLELLNQHDSRTAEFHKLEADIETARADFARFKETVDYRLEKYTARLDILRHGLQSAFTKLPATIRGDVERMLRIKGAKALAACADGHCFGCQTLLTPQIWSEVAAGNTAHCTSCAAILYVDAKPQ